MTSTFVPYSEIAPQTTHLPTLREEHQRCVAEHGRSSSQALESYLRYSHAAAEQGRPLDALRTWVENEEERFFAWTIAGADGHTYWNGPGVFRKNDGTQRQPRRWWWEQRNAQLQQRDIVISVCGEINCITPEHCVVDDRSARHRMNTDEQMIGALQIWSQRRDGASPTRVSWNASEHPAGMTSSAIMVRFGTWNNALRAAGLPFREQFAATPPLECVRAIQLARKILNRWPTTHDMMRPMIREKLRDAGLPSFATVFSRLGGSWSEALRRAGKRD